MPVTTMRERVQEISAEYWAARKKESERVLVAQLIVMIAGLEAELAEDWR